MEIYYSTSKCLNADIVLELLKIFSETCLFWLFQAQILWLGCCVTLKIFISGNRKRQRQTPGAAERYTNSPSCSSISTTSKSSWKMLHMTLCSLSYICIGPIQILSLSYDCRFVPIKGQSVQTEPGLHWEYCLSNHMLVRATWHCCQQARNFWELRNKHPIMQEGREFWKKVMYLSFLSTFDT